MHSIPKEQVYRRIRAENPWWQAPHTIPGPFSDWTPRAYFRLFLPLVMDVQVKRAVLLLGPRRVGKTVLLHHAIRALIEGGVDPKRICFISMDQPLYTGLGLEALLHDYLAAIGDVAGSATPAFIFFDEIQYLKDWEIHLKVLVDSYPHLRLVASGSSAAALRLKSQESGAGRFTDFLLPPLTFHEYLDLLGRLDLIGDPEEPDELGHGFRTSPDIDTLNQSFVHYLNFGGYPEVIFSPTIQSDPARFIKSDIVDKVLLRDLPSLYGIQDIQELNSLFTSLAYNTAQEVSLEALSKGSGGVAKNTIKRYIEYLEAAFLLKTVHRIDQFGKRFQRASFFKVYLTNPSIRAALFSPVAESEPTMGLLAETGIFSQWFHSADQRFYARWNKGEVDIVGLTGTSRLAWAAEVKWSDRCVTNRDELRSILYFCRTNGLDEAIVTTRTVFRRDVIDGIEVRYIPASLYCYTIGFNVVVGKGKNAVHLGSRPA